jgi:hypothetical protein
MSDSSHSNALDRPHGSVRKMTSASQGNAEMPDLVDPHIPDALLFGVWYRALRPDAQIVVSTMLDGGVNLLEARLLARAWPDRIRGPQGAAVVEDLGRGKPSKPIYFSSRQSDDLDAYFRLNRFFMMADGRPWEALHLVRAFAEASEEAMYSVTLPTIRHAHDLRTLRAVWRLVDEGRLRRRPVFILSHLLRRPERVADQLFRPSLKDQAHYGIEDIVPGPIEDVIELVKPGSVRKRLTAQ